MGKQIKYRVVVDDGKKQAVDREADSKDEALNRAGFLYRLAKYSAVYVHAVDGDKFDVIFDKRRAGAILSAAPLPTDSNWQGLAQASPKEAAVAPQPELDGATVLIAPIFSPRRLALKQVGEQGAWTLDWENPKISIGRDKSCDIVVPRTEVSRSHGNFLYTGSGFQYTDHSSNGSYLAIDNSITVVHKSTIPINTDGILFFSKDSLEKTKSKQALILFKLKKS